MKNKIEASLCIIVYIIVWQFLFKNISQLFDSKLQNSMIFSILLSKDPPYW
jgi:hypothetical protein